MNQNSDPLYIPVEDRKGKQGKEHLLRQPERPHGTQPRIYPTVPAKNEVCFSHPYQNLPLVESCFVVAGESLPQGGTQGTCPGYELHIFLREVHSQAESWVFKNAARSNLR